MMASNELRKIREDIERYKGYKASLQWEIENCEQEIAGCQKSINDPSTDENERERLKGRVEEYKGWIQWCKQEINDDDKTIMALGEKEVAIAISDVKNRDLFKEAMKKSCLEYPQLRVTIFGYAGSGKSHVLALMLGEPPPEIRTSTACAKKPVRTISHTRFGVDEKVLKRIGEEEYSQMMMKTARDGVSKSKFLKFKGKLCKVFKYVPSVPTDEVEKDLIVQFHKHEASVESLEGQTVGEVTDSGGQPQFLEILPRFIDNLSLGILVTDLSQRLDKCPMNYYYNSQGEPIGEGVRSLLTNEQILCRCMQMIVSQSQGGRRVKFVFVGTHRDLEHKCTESREEKNRKLIEMVKSFDLEDSVIYSNQQFNELIFALNAKEPEEADYQTAGVLIELMMDRSVAKTIRIPVNYRGVELTLKQKVRESNQIAFLESEILQDVAHFHLTKDTLKGALRYLHDIKLIFYFEEDFPGMVIGEPQAVLDKLTELVAYHIELTTNPKNRRALGGKWKKFSQCGILNIECLNKFPGQYVEGVFSPADMMKLFEKLFIVSEVNQGEYLMPCVLPMDPQPGCNLECETQSVPPMVLHFTRGVPRHGVYCGTICHVMTEAKWNLFKDPMTGKPFHLSRNSVHFSIPGYRGKVTINDVLDSFFLVSLHIPRDTDSYSQIVLHMCFEVRDTLIKAIDDVTEKLNYTPDSPKVAFLCEQHKDLPLHPATVSKFGNELLCTKDRDKGGTLTDQHRIWLKDLTSTPTSFPDLSSLHHDKLVASSVGHAPKKATSHSLSPADHFKVTKVLKALDNEQLIHLGTALGLEYPHLKRMQTLPEDMVAAWLNMEDEVMDTSGIPTWSSLIKALEDTDQKGVASCIRKEQHSNHPK